MDWYGRLFKIYAAAKGSLVGLRDNGWWYTDNTFSKFRPIQLLVVFFWMVQFSKTSKGLCM